MFCLYVKIDDIAWININIKTSCTNIKWKSNQLRRTLSRCLNDPSHPKPAGMGIGLFLKT